MNNVSKKDVNNIKIIRNNVSEFMRECSVMYDISGSKLLDIAPQDHEGAKPYFINSKVETLDIDKKSGATYIADLCENNSSLIPSNYFDVVVCTEVLEHTLNPFNAASEIYRILKPGGVALISTPYDFRIHGPLPDCCRFTDYGLKEFFKEFDKIIAHFCLF